MVNTDTHGWLECIEQVSVGYPTTNGTHIAHPTKDSGTIVEEGIEGMEEPHAMEDWSQTVSSGHGTAFMN